MVDIHKFASQLKNKSLEDLYYMRRDSAAYNSDRKNSIEFEINVKEKANESERQDDQRKKPKAA